ncbi:ROK family transcriptional regulator [Mycetocola miduiensis]|uniref:Sugar kinase of the NBD/HSP70 family, may contain an N-terminal HTH domain n=1 Tax=Mycetocola miduiensis TaxID=995034 RepID=A0A1I5C2N9_9MICO|nr:ROK family transcriptional regulator [Mycetocola miduiensis]SFN81156.1 Sugar kinase of the NBD/HSP70 family, may contain an N-terminal HTH domain [Mycetocola miduiensis]
MVDISPAALGTSATSDIFQILRDGRPRTRTELARITGLARSTVGLRIDSLMQLGLIGPADTAPSTGGRPSSQFALTGGNKVVLGVDIGATHVRIAVSDLVGRPLSEDSGIIDITEGPETVLNWVIKAGDRLIGRVGRSLDDLLAIGVGLPGPVEHSSGRPINPPIMPGWDNFDVPAWLGSHFDVPVLVDNDVNIMAIGERAAAWPQVDHLIFVKVATGIGAGVISRGMLQRGAQGVAGDIGHVRVFRDNETVCHCGNVGCIEAVASGPALAAALTAQGIPAETSRDVVELVRGGNPKAIQTVRQAGRDLGEILNACISLINPSVIVIGGAMAQAGEHLIAGVREVVYARSMPLATQHLQISQSSVGVNAAVLGASILAIHHVLSPESVEAMVVDLADAAAR